MGMFIQQLELADGRCACDVGMEASARELKSLVGQAVETAAAWSEEWGWVKGEGGEERALGSLILECISLENSCRGPQRSAEEALLRRELEAAHLQLEQQINWHNLLAEKHDRAMDKLMLLEKIIACNLDCEATKLELLEHVITMK